MNKEKTLEKILRAVILPRHPMFNNVTVHKHVGTSGVYSYMAVYQSDDPPGRKLEEEIRNETSSFFKMIGEGRVGISVHFVKTFIEK